jgi:hypothetical protein
MEKSMPYNGTPFDALMATPSPTLEQIQQTLYFIQTPETRHGISDSTTPDPLVMAILKAGEIAKLGDEPLADEYFKVVDAIFKIYNNLYDPGDPRVTFSVLGPHGQTALHVATKISIDSQVPEAIRTRMQKISVELLNRLDSQPLKKNDAGLKLSQDLPAQVDVKSLTQLVENILIKATSFKGNSHTAIELLADFNKSHPEIVKDVLERNSHLLNKHSNYRDIADNTTLPMQIMKHLHYSENQENRDDLLKLFNTVLDTKGLNLNEEVRVKNFSDDVAKLKETLYSTAFQFASDDTTKPGHTGDKEEREALAKIFQSIAKDLEKRGALPTGAGVAEVLRSDEYNTSWLDPAVVQKLTTELPPLEKEPDLSYRYGSDEKQYYQDYYTDEDYASPLRRFPGPIEYDPLSSEFKSVPRPTEPPLSPQPVLELPVDSKSAHESKPAFESKPTPTQPKFEISLPPPPATTKPIITKLDSVIAEKNLKKIEVFLSNKGWEIDRTPQHDTQVKSQTYLNVFNKNKPEENFQIYRDKMSTSSHSVEAYVTMLQTFKETYPGQMPKVTMSNPVLKANIEAAIVKVYPEKAANIKIIDRSAVAEKKNEEENDYKSPGLGRRR